MTNRIMLEDILSPEDCRIIDAASSPPGDMKVLSSLAEVLRDRFGLVLEFDPDIISGLIVDSSNLPGAASAVCRPRNERECAAAARACFTAKIPFTISAGRSNLTGSATPEGGVLVSLERMKNPDVRLDAGTATVQSPAGIILEDLRREVTRLSANALIFPIDPTSRTDAMVGGAIACNASGFTPGEPGAMRNWVERLDVLLPDGSMVRARRGQYLSIDGVFILAHKDSQTLLPVPRYSRPAVKNASGPYSSPDGVMDFVDLIIGSEGLFGIVTACQLRLSRRPHDCLDLFFSLRGEAQMLVFHEYLYHRLAGEFSVLSAFEYFGVNCRTYMDHGNKLFSGNDQVGIYLQIPLHDHTVDEAAREWFDILTQAPCSIDVNAVKLMTTDKDRVIFLEARHSMPARSLEVVQRRGTYTIMSDTVVPRESFGDFLSYTHGLLKRERLDYLTFGHLGDCHLHFMILPEASQLERATQVYELIVEKSAELGGVYSGEHGTGKRKRGDFLKCYGVAAVEQIRLAKQAVDPFHLLNRGNVIPFEDRDDTGP
ncbi:MAG: FAD-binding oxidoreductase [Bacteriovoracaceae bacterium]|nr:FAD-binding oxidoreductase [Bacteriovoracaceae bacterium]HRR21582.1 FAD-binding oxidoreductase [Desulfomonilia bacterium]HRR69745.1 FAD-binding oxidoreductase [Desulfomonilia bacterium]HRT45348.1 FAD-binding oxidoreductase [Desulfomonilia bacterium]